MFVNIPSRIDENKFNNILRLLVPIFSATPSAAAGSLCYPFFKLFMLFMYVNAVFNTLAI
jgi:hypothetical protein